MRAILAITTFIVFLAFFITTIITVKKMEKDKYARDEIFYQYAGLFLLVFILLSASIYVLS